MPGYEFIDKEEKKSVNDVFSNGGVLFRHGFDLLRNNKYFVEDFENSFSKKIRSPYSLAVSSGTAALRVALSVLDLKPNDEIITQSFTFVATVEAIVESRAKPVCANIDTSLNMCPNDLLKKITKKTKAVIVVHMLGSPARIREISNICKKFKISLIEDTAWGLGASVANKKLGTWGRMGTFSFDYAKTITTGEGGMIAFRNRKDYYKAKAWHDHGHQNNPKVPRWEDTRDSSGFNFRMTELQAAVGIAQLKKLNQIVSNQQYNKKKIWKNIKMFNGIQERDLPAGATDSCDSLVFFVSSRKKAHECRQQLLKEGLSTKILPEATTWHFAADWSHITELNKAHKGKLKKDLKISKDILMRAVSIPISAKKNNFFIPLTKIVKAINAALLD